MAQGLKFKFSMPDDESLAEYISIKGEKGDGPGATKTSELVNDSDFTTNAALNAGLATKADTTTVQSLTNQVNENTSALQAIAMSRVSVRGNNGNGRWYKLATFPVSSSTANDAALGIHGKMGAYESNYTSQVDITIANRSHGIKAYGDYYADSHTAEQKSDIVAYQNENDTVSVYLLLTNWANVDLDLKYTARITAEFDNTYVTTEPSGTLVWSLSEDNTNVQKNISGTISANIDGDAQTVNGHTVESDVPIGAVFTDTVYDDTALQTQIDLKANTNEVASTYATKLEVQSLANGSPLPASSVSEMTDTSRIYVLSTDGHWYYYNGSAWTDGGVYQATELADNSVSPRKTTFHKRSNNLYDKQYPSILHAVGNSDSVGAVLTNSVNSWSVLIPCSPSTAYAVRKPQIGQCFCVYEVSEVPVIGTTTILACHGTKNATNTYQTTFTTTDSTNYLLFFYHNSSRDYNVDRTRIEAGIMINEGSSYLSYEPYAYLDINNFIEKSSISNDKLAAQSLMIYEGKIYVDFATSKITLSDDLTDFVNANSDRRLTVASDVAREFSISDTRLMALTATISGTQVTSIQLELYSARDTSHPVIMYVCKATKTYVAAYEYNKNILTEARYAKMFGGNIVIDRNAGVIKLDKAQIGFLVGELFNQVNVNTAALPAEITLPDDYTSYALTLTVNGSTAESVQLEHWSSINPENHIICWLRGRKAPENAFSPYDYRGRIRYSDDTVNYENDVSLAMFNRIAAIGDSYTNGSLYYDGTAYTSPNQRLSYIAVMGRRNDTDWDNFGIGGITTRGYLTNANGLARVLRSEKSDLYFLALGINDANKLGLDYLGTIDDIKDDYTQNPDTFYGNYGKIIEQVQAYAPHAKFVMVGCMRPNSMNPNYGVFSTAIAKIAEHYGFPYINPYDDRFFTSSVMSHLSGNHPTAAGYTGIALALERLFARSVEENAIYFMDADYGSVVGD